MISYAKISFTRKNKKSVKISKKNSCISLTLSDLSFDKADMIQKNTRFF